MLSSLLHLHEELAYEFSFRHEVSGTHERIDGSLRCHAPLGNAAEDVFDVDDADDIVERITIDREARMRRRIEGLVQRGHTGTGLQPGHLGARDHHLVDTPVVEAEHPFHQLRLLFAHRPLLGADIDEHAQLGLGDRWRDGGPFGEEQPREQVGHAGEQDDQRPHQHHQQLDRPCRKQGDAIGVLGRKHLRRHLSEEGDAGRPDDDREEQPPGSGEVNGKEAGQAGRDEHEQIL